MKVRELIELLQRTDPDRDVVLSSFIGEEVSFDHETQQDVFVVRECTSFDEPAVVLACWEDVHSKGVDDVDEALAGAVWYSGKGVAVLSRGDGKHECRSKDEIVALLSEIYMDAFRVVLGDGKFLAGDPKDDCEEVVHESLGSYDDYVSEMGW